MKSAVLVVSTEPTFNTGDYIQGLAASQFFAGGVDTFVEREQICDYNGKSCRLIMNGWFMHHPNNWPPAPQINPLFVAFHVNSTASQMLSDKGIEYLKRHQPIGCRDHNTRKMLEERGVEAYFSGCLTLTLGDKYRTDEIEDKVYFVDPFCHMKKTLKNIITLMFKFICNFKGVMVIWAKGLGKELHPLERLLNVTAFYSEYSKVFDKEILLNAEYITQEGINNQTASDYFYQGEELIKKYAKARFVVTSRIHCALPCLGLETPVIYVEHEDQSEMSRCRLDGLRELFNLLYWNKCNCSLHGGNSGKITYDSFPKNSDKWRALRDLLRAKCDEFVKI